jgi:hypothetical protein
LGIAAMVPAIAGLIIDPHAFLDLWVMDDLSTKYEGLSSRGLTILTLAILGALVVVFTILSKYGSTVAEKLRPSPTRMRVFFPSEEARSDTTLTGIARRASVEIPSPISDEPCLLFGLEGEVGEADLSDADGGDFDLELPSGERVMVSLEHAVLVAAGTPKNGPLPDEPSDTLEELLERRGILHEDRKSSLAEHLVRDGDEVTVIGKVLGGKVTSLGYRGASGARVIGGDEERPLVVRIVG